MEKLKETEKFIIFEPTGKVPTSLEGLEKFLRDFVIWQEGLYSQIAQRINWLISQIEKE